MYLSVCHRQSLLINPYTYKVTCLVSVILEQNKGRKIHIYIFKCVREQGVHQVSQYEKSSDVYLESLIRIILILQYQYWFTNDKQRIKVRHTLIKKITSKAFLCVVYSDHQVRSRLVGLFKFNSYQMI